MSKHAHHASHATPEVQPVAYAYATVVFVKDVDIYLQFTAPGRQVQFIIWYEDL